MKQISRASSLVAVAALAAAAPARADGFKEWLSICGGSTFATCASVRVDVVGTVVTMRVRNLSGLFGSYGGTVFTAIGLLNVPANATSSLVTAMSGPVRAGDTPPSWLIANNFLGLESIKVDLGGQSNWDAGINGGIASNCDLAALPGAPKNLWMNPTCGTTGVAGASINGGEVVFSFDVDQTWDPSQGTELLVLGRNGPNRTSTECVTGPQGNCDVVPEPVSMALLATGLSGMGGFGLIRRRRSKHYAANA